MSKKREPTDAEIRAVMGALGRRGGLKKSKRKTNAARANAKKPRPRNKKPEDDSTT